MINFLVFNKILLLVISFIINNYGFSETVEYKKLNDVNENAKPLTLKYPEECKDIIDINNNDKFEIIGSNDIRNVDASFLVTGSISGVNQPNASDAKRVKGDVLIITQGS